MSIFSSMRYCLGPPSAHANLWAALAFMPFGLFFDFMDGKVARWRKKSSLMGQELDSLADLVSVIRLTPLPMNLIEHNRSHLASPLPLPPSLSAFVHLLTMFSSHSLSSADSPVLRASTSPLRMYRKMQRARANTLKEPQFPHRCQLQL
jgi:hypothetical protein